ncbi:YcjX family protein, partial [Candidatus Albibeggiatoa sp. nov. BB20]|uniref:YcjX family protein n=1 Tax=Candidatus Albibeggiatoa sp. nov. BB20 TaxID=3162723 RepID=UPI00336545E3
MEVPEQANKWLSNLSKANLKERLNRTFDRQVKLAVTGLSRSGKTVFITSLVHQLLHGLEGSHLPFFHIVSSGRLQGTKQMHHPEMHIPAFRYDQSIEQLCQEDPMWPEPTSGLSQIRVAVRYQTDNPLVKKVNPINTLFVDIVDYPGEWLLDLPLLELSYEDWSMQIAEMCEREPRLSLSKDWREFMAQQDVAGQASAETLRKASELYTDFLHRCKDRTYNLSLLQPGRFTMPGDLKGAPLLEFCPV